PSTSSIRSSAFLSPPLTISCEAIESTHSEIMVRNLVVIGGTSHPQLTQSICSVLGIPPADVLLSKFAVGETRVEIQESVRGKDVYIIQSGGGKVNDHLLELLITISACKTASARRVTAVLPLFPYSRQSDIPYDKAGAPLVKSSVPNRPNSGYTFESTPPTPGLGAKADGLGLNGIDNLQKSLARAQIEESNGSPVKRRPGNGLPRSDTNDSLKSMATNGAAEDSASSVSSKINTFQPRPGYKQWVAQAGTLVADLLTCAGADHIITMDLHDPQYQGYFDIPVDNLYGRPLLKSYIQRNIPNYKQAVIVSPDAGGAKRATAIADQMGMEFALIHKVRLGTPLRSRDNPNGSSDSFAQERRPTKITDRQNATMMLVGDVRDRIAILIDDLADTSNTITRAAKLVKNEGASKVYALLTHGILSGDAIDRINASALDKVVVTNSVDQGDHLRRCPKLEVLEVGHVFAEAIRRVHHGESISVLFQYD
ncbi:Ribose-phosphate diphosphokinase, partial [Penicillium maclennaniae]|uniref:Ribose-phosphate diphosphokinase n=1 Tax=Penicillium maclennaniae TaxID=1343394 RepID=UPI00253F8855